MRGKRPAGLRRALGPLGAMLAIGLCAGYLIGRDVMERHPTVGSPPSMATVAGRPGGPVPGATRSTTSDGAAGQRAAGSTPVPARTDTGSGSGFRFLLRQPDQVTPIRWNPCQAVRYKISLGDLVPVSEIPEVRAAFDTVGVALGGVTFRYDGTTDVVPDAVDGSAAADTDIVFAFARAGQGAAASDLLSGWEAGRGGLAAAGVTGPDGAVRHRPTHGSVVLDATKWHLMSRHDRMVLYLHEIGHAVGLNHPADGRQIMSSGAYDLPAQYQPGDLAGLARLGRQAGCTE